MTSDDRALDSNSVFLPRWESNTKYSASTAACQNGMGTYPQGASAAKWEREMLGAVLCYVTMLLSLVGV